MVISSWSFIKPQTLGAKYLLSQGVKFPREKTEIHSTDTKMFGLMSPFPFLSTWGINTVHTNISIPNAVHGNSGFTRIGKSPDTRSHYPFTFGHPGKNCIHTICIHIQLVETTSLLQRENRIGGQHLFQQGTQTL